MYDITTVYDEIGGILSMLDGNIFPQTYGYLAALDDDEDELSTAYEIASALINMDQPETLPSFMIEFITELYELEIAEGNADAMNDLGAQYYDGHRGFEQSFELAMNYYHMAAQNGSRQAQENLGYCYYYGRNGERDYEKAFHYFALGAFDGHLISLYKIGDMYLNGHYVEKNEKEAFYIYMRCINTMTDEAAERIAGPVYLRLGKLFMDGTAVDQDLSAALSCYQKAEFFLFNMVMNGDDMYRKSLIAAQEGLEKVRQMMMDALPENKWAY